MTRLLRPGGVYSRLARAEKAVMFYTMSLRVKKDIGDMTGEARCLVRIGLEFLTLNELDRAFEAYTEVRPPRCSKHNH